MFCFYLEMKAVLSLASLLYAITVSGKLFWEYRLKDLAMLALAAGRAVFRNYSKGLNF